ncbi:hypothetical protein O1L60_36910 [Streptomyces diastatochromogenes]|nr:hypothetical protein [Streptomyces diastatochromogenes]
MTLVAVLAPLTGCGASADAGLTDARPTTARSSAPLPAPRTAPAPAPLLSVAPKQGEVQVAEGRSPTACGSAASPWTAGGP